MPDATSLTVLDFVPQVAKLLSEEGRKICVLAVFRGNSAVFRLKVVFNVEIFNETW